MNSIIGAIIKERRIQCGIKQIDLADASGLDVTTIVKIEKGTRIARFDTLLRIYEILGITEFATIKHLMDDDVFESFRERNELYQMVLEKDYPVLEKKIDQLSGHELFQTGINKQLLVYCQCIVLMERGDNVELLRDMAISAIKIFIPNFQSNNIQKYLLANLEARLIEFIASTYTADSVHEKAVEIGKRLIENLNRSRLEDSAKAVLYPSVLHNLSIGLYELDFVDESIEACDQAVCICVANKCFHYYPDVMIVKSRCLYKQGDNYSIHRYIRQACAVCELIGDYKGMEKIIKVARQELGVEFF